MKPKHKVVFARSDHHVVDSQGCASRYRTLDGRTLAKGYYAVVWPAEADDPLFDEQAQFLGPYPTFISAQVVLEEAIANRARQLLVASTDANQDQTI